MMIQSRYELAKPASDSLAKLAGWCCRSQAIRGAPFLASFARRGFLWSRRTRGPPVLVETKVDLEVEI